MRPVVIVSTDSDTAELEALVASLPGEVEHRVIQRRPVPDGATYVGKGTVAELATWLKDRPRGDPLVSGAAWLVVSPHALRPSQVLGLQAALNVEVWDRVRLILELFRRQAHIKEAKLQVELAELRYELPLVREAIHRMRSGERPGFLAGGEHDVRTYEVHHKRRVRKIQGELRQVRAARRGRRLGRRRGGFRLLALVGHTNAGKSRLLNALCGSDTEVEDRYFSTLETRTRRLSPTWASQVHAPILLTDTVGFIRDLPPWLVDAFRSTLEEVAFADALLLLVDASEPPLEVLDKARTSLQVLSELGATTRLILVLTKKDKLRREHLSKVQNVLSEEPGLGRLPFVAVSSVTSEGIGRMLSLISDGLWATRRVRVDMDVGNASHAAVASWLHDNVRIVERTQSGVQIMMVVECDEARLGLLLRRAHRAEVGTQVLESTGKEGVSPFRG